MALSGREWTLTEAARSLGEPQHRLIYLCEKGVVQPDLEDAKGRGSSRLFSARNLLEFAVALHLRELELPASVIGAVTYTLRAFERTVQAQIRTFRLPDSLRGAAAPDLRAIISDGRLYLSLGTGKDVPKVYGGIDLKRFASGKATIGDLQRALTPLPSPKRPRRHGRNGDGLGTPDGGMHARVEISITSIAQELRLEG
jgi:DNA-binding transcriptional MerR regulator